MLHVLYPISIAKSPFSSF